MGIHTFGQENYWEKVAGPYRGQINDILTTPNDYIFAASAAQGLYLSTDNGDSWIKIYDERVLSLCYFEGKIYAASNNLLLVSTNYGQDWIVKELPFTIKKIVFNNQGILFAAKGGFNGGLIKSYDEGITWESVFSQNVGSIAFQPDNIIFIITKDDSYSSLYYLNLFKSTDNGDTWVEVNFPGTANPHYNVVATNRNGALFVGIENYYDFNNTIYQSTDNGTTWQACDQKGKIYVPNTFYVASNNFMYTGSDRGVARSTDNGNSWDLLNLGSEYIYINSITANSLGHVFASTKYPTEVYGLWRSTDEGLNWHQIGFILYEEVKTVIFDEHNNILVTTFHNIFRSIAGNKGWELLLYVRSYGVNSLAIDPKGRIYTLGHPVYVSDETGHNFVVVSLPAQVISNTMCFKDTNWVFIGAELYTFRSSQGGAAGTWEIAGLTGKRTYDLKVDGNGNLFAATDQGVWKTTNNGNTWTQLFYPGFTVTSLSLDLNDLMFAGTNGKGVYKSTDGGITWNLSNTGLLGLHIRSIIVNQLNHVFLGTLDNGVFISTDFGDSWNHINYGLDDWAVNSLSIDKNGYLYASTNSGIYKSISSTTSITDDFDSPKNFYMFQNYPNPFNPTTTIKFSIPRVEMAPAAFYTTLKVYDLLGREIATLVNEPKSPGVYEVIFNAEGLSSGVYFYRLTVIGTESKKEFRETKKMVLIR